MIYITIIICKLQKVIINVQRLVTYLWSTTIDHRNATFFTIVYKFCFCLQMLRLLIFDR